MDAKQLATAFTATVQASLHGLQSLESLLEREQAALSGREAEVLERVVAEKLDLLRQIEHGLRARDRLQQAAGYATGLEGGAQLVDTLQQDVLSADWATLVAAARRIAALNDRNGQLAMQGQRATRDALHILTGRPQRQDTYAGLRRGHGDVLGNTLGKV